MSAIRKQIHKLYIFTGLGNLSIAGAAWVLLLVSRGFSLTQVGFAETVFHLVSISAEIPSGMFADVMGRKRCLMVSCIASVLSAFAMAYWDSFTGVCVSMGFSALSYNFWTGTDNALAYDTLAEGGCEDQYDAFVSRQTIIYRLTNGIATFGAGIAVMIGNVSAQMIGVGIGLLRLLLVCSMSENLVVIRNTKRLADRIRECYGESIRFLKGNSTVAKLIIRNALIGAVDVLLLFFLQAKLPMTGIADWLLGPLLFLMSMGGVFGAWAADKVKHWKFKRLFLFGMTLVLLGLVAAFSGAAWIMTLGGFIAAFADDLIQIRADVELNEMVPAAQRATLVSVNSLCFSLVMIVFSPLAGWAFSL